MTLTTSIIVSIVSTDGRPLTFGENCKTDLHTTNTAFMYMQMQQPFYPGRGLPPYIWGDAGLRNHQAETIPIDCDAITAEFGDVNGAKIFKVLGDIIDNTNCVAFLDWRCTLVQYKSFTEGIRFQKWRTPMNEKDKGCWAIMRGGIDNDRERALISLDDGCFNYDIILHEIMHGLGFIHEQQRNDRDKYIFVRFRKIKNDTKPQYNYRPNANWTDIYGGEYSFGTVMHYGPYAGSVAFRVLAWVPRSVYTRNEAAHNPYDKAAWARATHISNKEILKMIYLFEGTKKEEKLYDDDIKKINGAYTCPKGSKDKPHFGAVSGFKFKSEYMCKRTEYCTNGN